MKVFNTNCMILHTIPDFSPYVCRIFLDKEKITFSVSAKKLEVTINPKVLYSIIFDTVVSGGTYMEDDTYNHVRIRYTKGFGNKSAKIDPISDNYTTISVAPLDDKQNEIYQISADCTELDKYIRKNINFVG